MKLLLSLIILLSTAEAIAFNDYDVEWPTSEEPGIHLLVITIDGCKTEFKVKAKDLYKFKNNSSALTEAIDTAIQRSESGCK